MPFKRQFGFTPAEARLASLLVDGKNLRSAATALDVSYETARGTLKALFQKTATHRQTELVIKLIRVTRLVTVSAALLAFGCDAHAGGNWPDGPNKHFLENLKRPDNHKYPGRDFKSQSCCGVADTVKTKYRVEKTEGPYPEDIWFAWLNEQWVRIPPDKIVPDYSPDGQPFLFLLAGTIQCFVRPKGGI
jgi:DNA-binding CsgD family transcriptional regulator